ncbi:hypothetical protein ACA910_005159 [Epithemia clementina (nom. ined.)]
MNVARSRLFYALKAARSSFASVAPRELLGATSLASPPPLQRLHKQTAARTIVTSSPKNSLESDKATVGFIMLNQSPKIPRRLISRERVFSPDGTSPLSNLRSLVLSTGVESLPADLSMIVDFVYVSPNGFEFVILDDLDLKDAVTACKEEYMHIKTVTRSNVFDSVNNRNSNQDHVAYTSAAAEADKAMNIDSETENKEPELKDELQPTMKFVVKIQGLGNKNGEIEDVYEYDTKRFLLKDSAGIHTNLEEVFGTLRKSIAVAHNVHPDRITFPMVSPRFSDDKKAVIQLRLLSPFEVTAVVTMPPFLRLTFEGPTAFPDKIISSEAITSRCSGKVSLGMLKRIAENESDEAAVTLLAEKQGKSFDVAEISTDDILQEFLYRASGTEIKLQVDKKKTTKPLDTIPLRWDEAILSGANGIALEKTIPREDMYNLGMVVMGHSGDIASWDISQLRPGRYQVVVDGSGRNLNNCRVHNPSLLVELVVGTTYKSIGFQLCSTGFDNKSLNLGRGIDINEYEECASKNDSYGHKHYCEECDDKDEEDHDYPVYCEECEDTPHWDYWGKQSIFHISESSTDEKKRLVVSCRRGNCFVHSIKLRFSGPP